eukprot:TRINITY_DN47422_c0_g1_i1.p1 TRINITY_DN47422_c0_g1~~TRINITY_DN47422_c0_g1_i1.p1  ORF type:complete len:123 (+),score=27.88 TRINITY_DN47422_c0_g1_i1:28-369(+)
MRVSCVCYCVRGLVVVQRVFFFSSRRRHTRCREVSWARRCVQETAISQIVSTNASKQFEEILNLRKSNSRLSKLNESLNTEIQSLKTYQIGEENQLVKSTTTENTSLLSLIHI